MKKQMDTEFISLLMGNPNMKASGKMICIMDMALNFKTTILSMKETFIWGRNKAWEPIGLIKDPNTKGNGNKIKFLES